MVDLSGTPLFDEWVNYSNTHGKTEASFTNFVQNNLTKENVDVPGSKVTAFYSGKIDGQRSSHIAQGLAERSIGQAGIIDNANVGNFIDEVTKDQKINKYFDSSFLRRTV